MFGASVETVFESSNSKLLVLEPDPENGTQLFVVDEELRVTILQDNRDKEGSKVTVIDEIDMSDHD